MQDGDTQAPGLSQVRDGNDDVVPHFRSTHPGNRPLQFLNERRYPAL